MATSGLRDSTLVFSARGFQLVLSLVSAVCLAWWLGPAGRGSFAVCMAFQSILGLIFVFGGAGPISFAMASKKEDISGTIANGFAYCLAMGSVGIVGGYFLINSNLEFFDKAPYNAFLISLLYIPIQPLAMAMVSSMASRGDFMFFAILSILQNVTQFAMYYLLVFYARWGVQGAVISGVVTQVIVLLIALMVYRFRHGARIASPNKQGFIEMISFGVRTYLGPISNLVNARIGTLILAVFASKSEIGYFALAMDLTWRVTIIPNSLGLVMRPRTASGEAGRPDLVSQCARISALICISILLILVLSATPVVQILFSTKFLKSVPLIRILAIGVAAQCAGRMFNTFLVYTNRPGLNSLASMVGMLLNIGLLLLLLPSLGLAGAAIATSCNYLVASSLRQFWFRKYSGMTLRETWRFRRTDFAAIGTIIGRLRNNTENKHD